MDLRQCYIYDDVLNADVVIDVPIAKDHSLARLTLGMKNLMGVIRDRPAMHRNLGQRIADLTSRVRPTLTVVDAVRILVDNGPTGGNLDDVKKMVDRQPGHRGGRQFRGHPVRVAAGRPGLRPRGHRHGAGPERPGQSEY